MYIKKKRNKNSQIKMQQYNTQAFLIVERRFIKKQGDTYKYIYFNSHSYFEKK